MGADALNDRQVENVVTWKARFVWIAIASASLPSLFETEWKFDIGFGSVYLADLLLAVAILVVAQNLRSTPYVSVLYYCALFSVIIGVASGASGPSIIRDSRPFVYMLAGIVFGAFVVANPRSLKFGLRTLVSVVSITALLAVSGQMIGETIVGSERGELNAVYYSGETQFLSAARVQSEPVPLALLMLCCICCAWILKYDAGAVIGKKWLTIAIISSIVLTTMAYSRNSLVGLGAALLLAVLIPSFLTRMERISRFFLLALIIVIFVAIPVWIGYQFGYFQNVIETFSGRVLTGIAPDVIGTDPSVGWRFTEMTETFTFISNHPLTGSGFGVFYRERISGEPFLADEGRLYIHNYFALLFVKFGVPLAAVILTVVVTSLRRLVQVGAHSSGQFRGYSVLACGITALFLVSAVAPVMYSRSFAVIGGLMIAVGLMAPRLLKYRDKSTKGI